MNRKLSDEQRKQIPHALSQGKTADELAREFQVSPGTIFYWKRFGEGKQETKRSRQQPVSLVPGTSLSLQKGKRYLLLTLQEGDNSIAMHLVPGEPVTAQHIRFMIQKLEQMALLYEEEEEETA